VDTSGFTPVPLDRENLMTNYFFCRFQGTEPRDGRNPIRSDRYETPMSVTQTSIVSFSSGCPVIMCFSVTPSIYSMAMNA